MPATSLPRLDGEGSGSIADYRGRWVLVNVWASWCTPCRDESPALERFYRAHRDRRFTILGIDSNDLSNDALSFVGEYGITYPQLRDGARRLLAGGAGTTGVPESFLVGPDGRLVLHRLGPVTGGLPRLERGPVPDRRGEAVRRAIRTTLLVAAAAAMLGAAAAEPKTTLPDIEDEVMCPTAAPRSSLSGPPRPSASATYPPPDRRGKQEGRNQRGPRRRVRRR